MVMYRHATTRDSSLAVRRLLQMPRCVHKPVHMHVHVQVHACARACTCHTHVSTHICNSTLNTWCETRAYGSSSVGRMVAQVADGELQLSQVPADDLALLPFEQILLLDTHAELLVWRAADVPPDDPTVALLERKAHDIAAARFPTAKVLSVAQGSTLERCFLCRLASSRRDPPTLHEKTFPRLQSIPAGARQAMLAHLGHTEQLSLLEWCTQCGVCGVTQ